VTFPGGLPIDVPFETSKLPLDVAVFNSARGATENAPASVVSKFLETVLLVGGGSLVRGLADMLQQRYVPSNSETIDFSLLLLPFVLRPLLSPKSLVP
jgi:actin-related protein 8